MKNPWLAWYPGDYLSKTRALTMAQHGAYTLLLWEYYINGPIPAIAQQVMNICLANAEQDKIDVGLVLSKFFTLKDGYYRHNRADEEINKRQDISNKRVVAAKSRHKVASISSAIAQQMTTQPQPQPQPQLQKSKSKSFVKPSLEEVQAYCQERGNTVNPEAWLDYYDSNGWHVGRNSMKNWKAAVRYWERNGNTNDGGRYAERQVSKNEQRVAENRKAILVGLGFIQETGRSEPDLQDSDAAGRSAGLATLAYRAKSRSN
jgi:uncharacterized protein YdaU (DUF1376 family)